jgi:hypothetical protein
MLGEGKGSGRIGVRGGRGKGGRGGFKVRVEGIRRKRGRGIGGKGWIEWE